jgi:prevent-host-death family protein
MDHVASRDLRNNTAGVIRRVQEGKTVIVTVNGRPAAQLMPITVSRRHWISRDDLVGRLRLAQADVGLRDDLARLAGEMTDD